MQNRFKSKVLWAAITAQVLSVLVLTAVITPTESETINTIIGSVLQILTLLGIVNNPTSSEVL